MEPVVGQESGRELSCRTYFASQLRVSRCDAMTMQRDLSREVHS
jgi:hypothetical protein